VLFREKFAVRSERIKKHKQSAEENAEDLIIKKGDRPKYFKYARVGLIVILGKKLKITTRFITIK
jgi:hypothetical protein